MEQLYERAHRTDSGDRDVLDRYASTHTVLEGRRFYASARAGPCGQIRLEHRPASAPAGLRGGQLGSVQASVPVGKPGPHTYFQVHPEWQIHVATLAHEDALYLVSASLRDALEGDTRIKLVVPYITRDGDVGFWPLNPVQATGRTDEWTASAHRVLIAARKGWVRMRSNMRTRSYDLIRPEVAWEEPTWPGQDFESLLEAALGDRVIDTLDHPVVRALAGEA